MNVSIILHKSKEDPGKSVCFSDLPRDLERASRGLGFRRETYINREEGEETVASIMVHIYIYMHTDAHTHTFTELNFS